MDRTSVVSRSQTNIPLPAQMPSQAYMPMPSVHGISGLGDDASTVSTAVTPTTLVQRLPSIVTPSPTDLGASCDAFSLWVSENPVWALGGLAVIAYFAVLKGKS